MPHICNVVIVLKTTYSTHQGFDALPQRHGPCRTVEASSSFGAADEGRHVEGPDAQFNAAGMEERLLGGHPEAPLTERRLELWCTQAAAKAEAARCCNKQFVQRHTR